MKHLQKIYPQLIGSLLIAGLLYFGSFWMLCSLHLPPKIVVAGMAGTVQQGPRHGMHTNDAPVSVPFGLQKPLNFIYDPLNQLHRQKTGFGIWFVPKRI